MKNKFDGGYDSCKIKELYQTPQGKIYGEALNQENGKMFEINFSSINHLKNALNMN